MIQRGTAVILVLMTANPSLVTAQDLALPFVVGVWGQGDAVIPFADFDGQRWRSSWPAPVETEPAPRPLQRVPVAWWGGSTFQPTWELVEPNARRSAVQVTGTAPAGLGSNCSSNLGLTTDAPTNTYQYGAVLATSRSRVIEPVETLTPKDTDWLTLSALLPDIYRRHEATAWNAMSDEVRPDLSAPLSRPRLDAAFAFTDEAGEYVYFESSREFARRREQLGSERSFITGWLWRPSSTTPFQLVTVQPATHDDDGKGEASFRPLGVVRHRSQRFWVGALSSYAYAGMTVLEVRRAGIKQLLRVDYAGC